ncbi:hypothetical protein ACG04Q_19275 [Roseateles sp. DXS20W]|uniref:Uncharacterized protein n=1 Tax=Pelomonas lactea TaxID=3299030 RepID=A0ABW7GP44_9BURK
MLEERILREYASTLLNALPHVDWELPRDAPLIRGYRWLTVQMVTTARRFQHAARHRSATPAQLKSLRDDAEAARAGWEAVHLQLVAQRLGRLYADCVERSALELVLLAEQTIEELVIDVEADKP